MLDAENAAAARRGLIGRFASPHDAFAIVGAITELVSRQVRLGEPDDVLELAPVIDRLIVGLLARRREPSTASAALEREVVSCRRCPRLVAWREEVARVKRAAFADEEYWGRPLPGFGDPAARGGRARAGAGRPRRQPHRARLHRRPLRRLAVRRPVARRVRQPAESVARDDGLRLPTAGSTAAVRCAPPANKPTPAERDTCLPYLVRELALLAPVRA